MEKLKPVLDDLPEGYPSKCSREVLVKAIKDLSDEFLEGCEKSKDFSSRGWKDRILAYIQLGQSELQRKNNEVVLILNVLSLLVALCAIAIALYPHMDMVTLRKCWYFLL